MKQGWEIKKLGDVLNIERGGSPRPIKKYLTNSSKGINWIKISDATASNKYIYETKEKITKDGLHKTRLVNEGDFLLSNSMSFGRPYIMKTTGCIHDGWLVLKQNDRKIFETDFLYYLLSSPYLFQQFDSLAAGSTVRNLNIRLVSSVEVPIPPLPEQQRIVSILDKAFAAIDKAKANTEQNLQNAKELFESYLQGVFEKKGNGWEEKTIGDLGKPSMCKRILKEQTSTSGDIPFYKIGTFGKIPNAFISEKLYKEYRAKYSFPKVGDVLISASGTIGRRVIYDGKPAFFQDSNIVWIDNNEEIVLNDYLYFFYGYCDWQPEKGATISRLYNSNLKRIKISFPKSLQHQQQIVNEIKALQVDTKKLECIYQQKIEDIEELKKSILQKAFAGELETEKVEIV
ncbi:MAG: restriction endonuclease subunit S [Bacteroidales bacterium]|jgi:type I restriction enzyme S subunit|nr:restriction endonuclease subunit S [Bacteroidales bacterium]